eukprot:2130148-Rhodomonas_salina.2
MCKAPSMLPLITLLLEQPQLAATLSAEPESELRYDRRTTVLRRVVAPGVLPYYDSRAAAPRPQWSRLSLRLPVTVPKSQVQPEFELETGEASRLRLLIRRVAARPASGCHGLTVVCHGLLLNLGVLLVLLQL